MSTAGADNGEAVYRQHDQNDCHYGYGADRARAPKSRIIETNGDKLSSHGKTSMNFLTPSVMNVSAPSIDLDQQTRPAIR
jgi:hypothetical protein